MVLGGLLNATWFLPPVNETRPPRKVSSKRRATIMRKQGPDPLATHYGEAAKTAKLEKPWVQRLLCYIALFIVCLAPCISVVALVGWALSMDAEDLRNRIDLDLGIGEQDECDEKYVPGNTSQVITSNENKLEAAVSTNFTTFAILVGVYCVLHCKEPRRFYRNPLKRGFGPERPDTAFGWLLVVLKMPLDEVERHVGADGRALLEFIALVLRVLAAYSFFALLSLCARRPPPAARRPPPAARRPPPCPLAVAAPTAAETCDGQSRTTDEPARTPSPQRRSLSSSRSRADPMFSRETSPVLLPLRAAGSRTLRRGRSPRPTTSGRTLDSSRAPACSAASTLPTSSRTAGTPPRSMPPSGSASSAATRSR